MIKRIFIYLLLLIFTVVSCRTFVSKDEIAEIYYNLGNAYVELGKNNEAETAYRKALYYNKNLNIAGFNLAKILIIVKKYDQGMEILTKLLEEYPDNAVYLKTYAFALYSINDLEKSLQIYGQILDRDEYDKEALYNKSIVLWGLGHKQESLDSLLMLFGLDKDFKKINLKIGLLYFELEDFKNAIIYLKFDIENNDNEEALKTLAKAYVIEKYYGKAIEIYTTLLDLNPKNSVVLFEKAFILYTIIQNENEAFELLEKAILAGFKDKAKLLELLNSPELISNEKIKDLLIANNLISENDLKKIENN